MVENTNSEQDLQNTRTRNEDWFESNHRERNSVSEDVTIPTNILRYVKPDKEWAPGTGLVGVRDHHRSDSSPTFNVVDIALDQQAAIDYALGNASANQPRRTSRTKSNWDHSPAVNRRHTSLPAFDEEKKDVVPILQRKSTSGKQALPTVQRGSFSAPQDKGNVSIVPQVDDTVLFRSLDGYVLMTRPAYDLANTRVQSRQTPISWARTKAPQRTTWINTLSTILFRQAKRR